MFVLQYGSSRFIFDIDSVVLYLIIENEDKNMKVLSLMSYSSGAQKLVMRTYLVQALLPSTSFGDP